MKAKYLNLLFLFGLYSILNGFSAKTVLSQGAQEISKYDKQWKEALALTEKGKPRSAIEIMDNIFEEAKKDKDEVQMLKSLEYRIRLGVEYEEEYVQKGIAKIKSQMEFFSAPSTQLLHSLLADLYLGYYSRHRYIILDRTNLFDYEQNDMATWDQQRFAEKIFDEFKLSLADPELLQNTAASDYADILQNNDSLDIFRPSLYDILAHTALDFYRNDEFMASRPAIRFEIDNTQMMDVADAFVKLELNEKERFSMHFHALKLFRELTAFHLHDENHAALVDVDLQRLEFVYNNAVFENKEKIYLHTLEQMEKTYIDSEPITEIYHRIAQLYFQSLHLYQPLESDEHQRDLIIAAQYCENAIKEFPDSYGAALCKVLLKKIKETASDIPVIVMTGEPSVETATDSVRFKAYDYLQKPVNKNKLTNTVYQALEHKKILDEKKKLEAENKTYRENLESLIIKRTKALQAAITATIETISSMLELRDPYTGGHDRRVGNLASDIAEKLKLTPKSKNGRLIAGYLHDIGKISIPSEILSKP